MTFKEQIEADAIREASALEKQGRTDRSARRHVREATDYNEEKFSRLFKNQFASLKNIAYIMLDGTTNTNRLPNLPPDEGIDANKRENNYRPQLYCK